MAYREAEAGSDRKSELRLAEYRFCRSPSRLHTAPRVSDSVAPASVDNPSANGRLLSPPFGFFVDITESICPACLLQVWGAFLHGLRCRSGRAAGVCASRAIRVAADQCAASSQEYYGQFYNGDSYIVLYTNTTGSGAKAFNLHFWLGQETSQDEAGVAAYKTVELDDKLGGQPVQYRECSGHESVCSKTRVVT